MIIETRDLSRRFTRHAAVSDVNLHVPEGALYALIGANGAGKTTTMRLLMNILAPDRGSARVLGTDSRALRAEHRLRIGYLSENQTLPERLSVDRYFDYLRSLYSSWDRQFERRLREQFELPPQRPLGKLSHGMRMKVMLVGVMAFRPSLLILDEPLSGLDPLVRDEVMSGILGQAAETTILISSHELSELEGCTTHVGFMAAGRLLLQESVDSLAARFREVTATLVTPLADDRSLPGRWVDVRRQGSCLRFVETAFVDDEALGSELARAAGPFRFLESVPLSLRDCAKALIRATRREV